jgi:hypothetical protein
MKQMRNVTLSVAFGGLLSSVLTEQTPDLTQLLRHVAAYVQRYEEQLSSMVAEESYRQTLRRRSKVRVAQTTTSDFLFLKGPDTVNWVGFRDVYTVDGQPVRQPEDRFGRLLRESADAMRQAAMLAEESARYNIGPVVRTINVPTLVLGWLRADVQGRFEFQRKGQRSVAGGGRCRVVRFYEREVPALIRGRDGSSVRSSGTFCASDDGRVWLTEVEPGEKARITVIYRHDPHLEMLVPSEMRELYRGPFDEILPRDGEGGTQSIECVATYSRFRRFDVTARIR